MKRILASCLPIALTACSAPDRGPAPDAGEIALFAGACLEGPGYSPAICECLALDAAEAFDETRYRLIRISLTGAPIREAAARAGLDRDETGRISRYVNETLPACAERAEAGEPQGQP